MGFKASEADPGLYILKLPKGDYVFLLVYVDDIIVLSNEEPDIDQVVAKLEKVFGLRDLGYPVKFLGMEIKHNKETGEIKLSQQRMCINLVAKYKQENAKHLSTPLSTSTKLTKDGQPLDQDSHSYSELVGSLLYLSVCTRPDITQAVGVLARYMSKPTEEHWTAAKSVLRYIAGTTDYGIRFVKSDNPELQGYCDADYAGDTDTRRSTTGYVFIMNSGVISWSSRLQPTVAASTTEAEYMAAAYAVKEALWLRKLLADINKPQDTLEIFCDNQAALTLLKHPISSVRSKHIDVIYHFARERVLRKEVSFSYISTKDMVADCMTKAVPKEKFTFCCELMGVDST